MNELIFDSYIYESCELLEQALNKLHESVEYCECDDDRERVKQILYDLHLLYDKLFNSLKWAANCIVLGL